MTQANKNLLTYVALAVLAVSFVGVYYYFKDYFKPKAAQTLSLDSHCDLHQGSCKLPLPNGGEVSFEIIPNTIPLLEPMQLEVVVAGAAVAGVEVDFAGVTMNMGFNRTQLQSVGNGKFSGTIILPVCIRNRMDWQANVMLKMDNVVIVAPFRFETIKGG